MSVRVAAAVAAVSGFCSVQSIDCSLADLTAACRHVPGVCGSLWLSCTQLHTMLMGHSAA